MASRTLKVEIIGDASSFQRALNNASGTSGKFGGTIARMGKLAAAGMAAIGVGAVIAGKRMVSMASDAAEVDSKLDVVFGKALPKLTKNLDTFAEATGASRFQLREQAADMGALLVPLSSTVKGAADMSEQFVKLATDLGSFNNVPVEEALLAIRSGLVGEAEPLRRFGVLLNEAAVKAEAYSSGIAKTGEELTEQQKVQARANLIMEQTTLAQEDATRTAGSAANQFKALSNNLKDAGTEMGAKLLPAVLAVVKAFNENWPQIEKVVDQVMDVLISGTTAAAQAVQANFDKIKAIAVAAFGAAKSAVQNFVNFIRSDLGQQLATSAVGILAVTKAVSTLAPMVRVAMSAFSLMGRSVGAALIPFAGLAAIGALVGELAGDFIKGKLAAQELASAMDTAAGSASALKGSLDALKDSDLAVKEARNQHTAAVLRAQEADRAYQKVMTDSNSTGAQRKQSLNDLEAALLGVERSELTVTEALRRQATAHQERTNKLKEGADALFKLTAEGGRANNTFAQTETQQRWFDSVKKIGDEATKTAQKTKAMGDEVGSRSAAKVAAFADIAVDLAKKLERVPSKKEIIAEARLRGGPAFAAAIDKIIDGADKAQKGAKTELDKLPGHVDSAIAAGNREATGASVIAGTITSGIESGFNFGGIISIVRQGVRDAIAAGANAGSTTKDYAAKEIGKPLSEGPIEQVKKDAPKLAEVTVASVRKAVGAAQLAAAAAEIGGPAVQKIINDIVGKTPSLKAQFAAAVRDMAEAGRQAIADARQSYGDAFASLFQAGFDAIAAKYAGWQPPSLLKAQREAEAREKAALLQSVKDAQSALQALMTPLTMEEGETAEAFLARLAARDAEILAAQKTLDDLLFQQRQAALTEKAAQEQKAHDASIAREQQSFAKRLAVIMREHRNVNARVQALLKEFDIDFLNAGTAWGNSLAEGIRSAKKAVEQAAKELAQVMKDNLKPGSPAKKGPLSTFDMFKAGRQFGMDFASGVASAAGAANKAAATTAGGASGGFGDAKNTGNIFDFGSGTPPPGGFGPDFEGSRPGWADRELWETTAIMAAKLGKFDALIDAVQSGSIKANAGLLSQLFYARTRQTWNDFPARIAKILDDMRGPEGLSSAEAAAKYGLKQGGYTKKDGFAFLHKNEIVTPLPSSGRMSMGSQAININFNGTVMGGTEAQMARVLAPAIENEIRRSQRRGNASIVQAT